jgi:2',3'-cyclic-nucleotide 2'-phosphodiesterase (5'-nucleotidase family)
MSQFSTWLQAGAVGLTILLIGAIGVVAMNGQLRFGTSQSTWKLTVLHTNDVRSSVEPCS